MASGRGPFAAPDLGALVHRVLHVAPEPLAVVRPDAPFWLAVLLEQLLEKRADARPASAALVRDALRGGTASAWWAEEGRRRAADDPRRRLRVDRATPFVGRVAARRAIREAAAEAAEGRGVALLVTGPAGVGSTRLVDAAIEELATEGGGRRICVAVPAPGLPYAVAVLGELERFLEGPPGGLGATGSRDLPDARAAIRLGDLVRAAAETAPRVVVLDGLHTSAPESVELVVGLALAVRDRPVLVLATARDEPAVERALATVVGADGLRRVELGPLDAGETEALVAARTGDGHLARHLAPVLHEASGGLPAETLALVAALARRGGLRETAPGRLARADRALDLGDTRLPRDAAARLDERLAPLDDSHREVLDAAACLGTPFEPALVARVVGRPVLAVLRDLTHLARTTGIVVPFGRRFAFESPRTCAGARARVPEAVRAQLHVAIVRALVEAPETAGSEPADLLAARHAVRAEDRSLVRRHLEPAVARLVAAGARSDAAELLRAALDAPGLLRGLERATTLLRLGDPAVFGAAYVDFGRRLHEAFELATQGGAPGLASKAATREAQIALLGGDLGRADARAAHACRLAAEARDEGALLGAERVAASVARACGRTAEAETMLRRVVERATALRDAPALAAAQYTLGLLLRPARDPEPARGQLEAALATARAAGLASVERDALAALAFYPYLRGDAEAALALQRPALAAAERVGDGLAEARILGNLARTLLGLGRLGEALERAGRAVELARHHAEPKTTLGALRILVQLRGLCGAFEAADAALAELRALEEPGAAVEDAGFTHVMEGNLRLSQGRAPEAVAAYDAALRVFAPAAHENGRMWALLRRGRARLELGEGELARDDLSEALEAARGIGVPVAELAAGAALARMAGGVPPTVRRAREAYAARLAPHEAAWADHDLYLAEGDPADLVRARAALRAVAASLPAPLEATFLRRVALHRAILGGDEDDPTAATGTPG